MPVELIVEDSAGDQETVATKTVQPTENGELVGLLDLQDAAIRVLARRSLRTTPLAVEPFLRRPVSNVS